MSKIFEVCLLISLAGFYVIKGYLSEKGIISDECNECINNIITDSFSNDD